MKVNFYAKLREITGGKEIEIPAEQGITAKGLLAAIIARYPAIQKELLQPDGRLFGQVHLTINGRDVQFLEDELDTVIKPEDEISVFPAVGGG